MKKLITAGLAAVVLSSGANAAIVTGSVTGGTAFTGHGSVFTLIAQPATIAPNSIESFDYFGWNEYVMTLSEDLSVDLLAATWAPGVLAAGTRVASHGLAYDPPNDVVGLERTVIGSVTFDSPILGVIIHGNQLYDSDFLANGSTTFSIFPNRGAEDLDVFWMVAGDPFTLYFDQRARNPGDNIRVLTMVPEASTWAMLIAGFGMIGFAARRRKAAIA